MKLVFCNIAGLILISALLAGCSVVFDSSVTGMVVDKDDYEHSAADPGINDVQVYCYLDPDKRQEDIDLWNADGTLPEGREKKNYLLDSTTAPDPLSGINGIFSFDSVVWKRFFPKYGKSEDIRETYFLLFHESYGMNAYDAALVSDTDTLLGPIQVERTSDRLIRYGGQLSGIVWYDINSNFQYDAGEEINGAEIKLYLDKDSPPAAGDVPDYGTYSLTDPDSGQSGVYQFSEAVWQDIMNADRFSEITSYCITNHPTFGTKIHPAFSLYANTANFQALEL